MVLGKFVEDPCRPCRGVTALATNRGLTPPANFGLTLRVNEMSFRVNEMTLWIQWDDFPGQ